MRWQDKISKEDLRHMYSHMRNKYISMTKKRFSDYMETYEKYNPCDQCKRIYEAIGGTEGGRGMKEEDIPLFGAYQECPKCGYPRSYFLTEYRVLWVARAASSDYLALKCCCKFIMYERPKDYSTSNVERKEEQ